MEENVCKYVPLTGLVCLTLTLFIRIKNFNNKYNLTKIYNKSEKLNLNNNDFTRNLINCSHINNFVKLNQLSKTNISANNFNFAKINNLVNTIMNNKLNSLYSN